MKLLKFTVLLVGLTTFSVVNADVPVIDAYQQADNSQPNQNQANNNLADDNSSGSQPAGIDLSQTQAQSPAATAQAVPPQNSNLPMNQRVQILEQQAANTTQLLNQMNALQQQIQELRGQLETQTHNVQVLQTQLQSQYKDLDQRLSQNSASSTKITKASGKKVTTTTATSSDSTATASVSAVKVASTKTNSKDDPDNTVLSGASVKAGADSGPPVPPPAPKVAITKDQEAYQNAFALLRDKKYPEATNAFQDFLETYPSGKNVVNAHYWLGQLFLLQGQPDSAIEQFKTILQTSPGGSKVPDTMVQLGLAYYAKGDLPHARAQLAQVQEAYPDSPAAKLAKTRLQQIMQANAGTMSGAGQG